MMKTREFHVTVVTNDAWIGGRKVMSSSRKARTALSRQTSGCSKNFLLLIRKHALFQNNFFSVALVTRHLFVDIH